MYPSDYGYATAGGATTNRAACLAKEMLNWDGSDVSDCKNNDYLFKLSSSQWTLVPYSSNPASVFNVYTLGIVDNNGACDPFWVRPTLYLKSNISITDMGNGTSESPYQLRVS